jgi:hypothetical protein
MDHYHFSLKFKKSFWQLNGQLLFINVDKIYLNLMTNMSGYFCRISNGPNGRTSEALGLGYEKARILAFRKHSRQFGDNPARTNLQILVSQMNMNGWGIGFTHGLNNDSLMWSIFLVKCCRKSTHISLKNEGLRIGNSKSEINHYLGSSIKCQIIEVEIGHHAGNIHNNSVAPLGHLFEHKCRKQCQWVHVRIHSWGLRLLPVDHCEWTVSSRVCEFHAKLPPLLDQLTIADCLKMWENC